MSAPRPRRPPRPRPWATKESLAVGASSLKLSPDSQVSISQSTEANLPALQPLPLSTLTAPASSRPTTGDIRGPIMGTVVNNLLGGSSAADMPAAQIQGSFTTMSSGATAGVFTLTSDAAQVRSIGSLGLGSGAFTSLDIRSTGTDSFYLR